MPGYLGNGRWTPYVSVAQRERQAKKEVARLRKAGQRIDPVEIEGTKIATTFWGKAWCDSLESYRDYENRLPRGRTYVRNGSVVDLQISAREVTAIVSGSEIYRVAIEIDPLPKTRWRAICQDCARSIDSMIELLQGKFSKGVMQRLCDQKTGLFPPPRAIAFSCTCPDSASLCKHVAAALYGVGARLDAKPELLFRLRDVDAQDLVVGVGEPLQLAPAGSGPANVLADDDLGAIFGIEMAEVDASEQKTLSAPPAQAAPRAAANAIKPGRTRTTKKTSSSSETAVARRDAAAVPDSPPVKTQSLAQVAARKNSRVEVEAPGIVSPAMPSVSRHSVRRGAGTRSATPERVLRWVGARRAKSKTRASD